VRERAQQLGIASQVVSARCSDAQLLACYRTADIFWSMSEHEGFCVPLVEAMWFDVPVLAFRSSAVPETLGQAGVMFTEKRPVEVAALAHLLIEDGPLRRTVLDAQRRRRRDFLPDATLSSLLELLRALGAADVAESRVGS
jgi:glycosyltransferase involved in cell wall biosynthesis